MHDFEPYFCTEEKCRSPLDVPNTFEGLLGHMQAHMPYSWQVETADGEAKELHSEEEFTSYL